MDPPEEIDYGLEGDLAFPTPEELRAEKRQTPPKLKDIKVGGQAIKEGPQSSGSYQKRFDAAFMGSLHKVFTTLGSLSQLFGQPDPGEASPSST